jgi:SAM-dependent methyltransferase
MIETINFKEEIYPAFQAKGFAAKFAFPFALEVCKGDGLDVGYNKPEWKFPGALGVDDREICVVGGKQAITDESVDALHFPHYMFDFDYIFSSHCLEHLLDWVEALDYWYSKLKVGGVLFLYLPDHSQHYWRPHNNRKHIHAFTPAIIESYLRDKYKKVFISGVDLNNSFCAMAEK